MCVFSNSYRVDMIIYLRAFFLNFISSRYYNLRTGKLSFKQKVPSTDNFSPKLKVPSAGKVSPKLKVPSTGNFFVQTQSPQCRECFRSNSKSPVLYKERITQTQSPQYRKSFRSNSKFLVQEIF